MEETEGQWETINDPVTYLATPPSSKNAVVRPNVLDGGKLYKFILYSWIPSAKSRGFSAFEREVNKPPMDGTCGMTPEKGYTMQTKFNVTCKNWFDADRPLSYALYTLSEDGSESLVTSWRGSKDASNEVVFADGFKLPEGTGVGGNLTVFVEVSDTEKSSSTYKFFVTVRISAKLRVTTPRKYAIFAVRSPWFWVSGYYTKWQIQGRFSKLVFTLQRQNFAKKSHYLASALSATVRYLNACIATLFVN